MEYQDDFYVVAIGLSAGGTEALQDLLYHLPPEPGAAFVVISHLLPTSESRLDKILTNWTTMQVNWIKSGDRPSLNSVHILPPGKVVTMEEGKFQLRDRGAEEKINWAVSIFFTSLAAQVQHRAIGVILSGTGSDGLEGVKAIEAEGGIVMVQDPVSARFNGMPANIISEDHPDVVTTPRQLAKALMSHLKVPPFSAQSH